MLLVDIMLASMSLVTVLVMTSGVEVSAPFTPEYAMMYVRDATALRYPNVINASHTQVGTRTVAVSVTQIGPMTIVVFTSVHVLLSA